MATIPSFAHLPPSCPPASHQSNALEEVWRLLSNAAPVTYDWLSHAQRGKPLPPGADACEWASLSLMKNPSVAKKLRNLRHLTHAARLSVPANVGAHLTNGNHVHYWADAGTNVASFVVSVARI